MPQQGINFENVKRSNRNAILKLLNNCGPMSRKDIAETVGLTPASVTLICAELIEEGVLMELGEAQEKARVGRKKILVSINNEYKFVFCVGIETEETYISITDILGNVIRNVVLVTDSTVTPEVFLKTIADGFKKLMWESGLSKDQILGVGVSIPGKVDCEKGISINTYNIWEVPVDIRSVLEAELGIPVFLENNVKAYALSELLFGSGKRDDNLLVLKWGPGVGSSIIANTSIYQGANGSSAELGHMIVNTKGAPCKCGRKGCLQTEISTHAIIDSILEAYGDTEESHKAMPAFDAWLKAGNEIRYRNVADWASLADEKLQAILDIKISFMAHAVVNGATLLDPSRIVAYGYLFDASDLFERFKAECLKLDPAKDDDFVVKSELSQRQDHTEALSVVLDRMFYLS